MVIPPSIATIGKTAGAVGLEMLPVLAGGAATIGLFKLFEPKETKMQKFTAGVKTAAEIAGALTAIGALATSVLGYKSGSTKPEFTQEQYEAAVNAEAKRLMDEAQKFNDRVNAAVSRDRQELAAERAAMNARVAEAVAEAIAAHEANQVLEPIGEEDEPEEVASAPEAKIRNRKAGKAPVATRKPVLRKSA